MHLAARHAELGGTRAAPAAATATVTAIVGGSAMLPVVAVTLYALIMLVLRRKPWLFTLCDCSSCCSKRRPTLQVPATQAQLSPRLNAAI